MIIFIYEREMPTVEMLRTEYRELLQGQNVRFSFRKNKSLKKKDIEQADVLILIRPHEVLSQKIAEYGRKAGCFVIIYLDDDLIEQATDTHAIPWRLKALERTLKVADALMSPNQYLCQKYQNKIPTGRGAVINFCVTDKEFSDIPKKQLSNGAVKLVYAAGRHHAREAEKTLYPLMKQLNDRYKDRISVTFVGVRPQINPDEFNYNVEFVEGMPLEEYREWMRNEHFDIGFAPLDGTSFDRMKCFVKYTEYTLVGVVGVYSRCEPYTFVIRDGKDGFLVEGEKEWYEKTTELIDDSTLRRQFLEEAVINLHQRFSQTAILSQLREQLPEMFKKKASVGKCGTLVFAKMRYYYNLILDYGYLFVLYLKRSGLRSTFKRGFEHFKIVGSYKTKRKTKRESKKIIRN